MVEHFLLLEEFRVTVAETYDEESGVIVLEARDRHGRFLGVVSEETKAEAQNALRDLVLEVLLDSAEELKKARAVS